MSYGAFLLEVGIGFVEFGRTELDESFGALGVSDVDEEKGDEQSGDEQASDEDSRSLPGMPDGDELGSCVEQNVPSAASEVEQAALIEILAAGKGRDGGVDHMHVGSAI